MISVYRLSVIYGICLCLFADAILFDLMLKTAFGDGVDTIQDLIDRDMSLGIIQSWSQSVKLIFSYLGPHAVAGGRYENLRLRTLQNTRNDNQMYFVDISPITCSGTRTVSYDSWRETDKMILDKVLTDERTTAYASTIEDINTWWSDCKDCNWYKSEQNILSEARLSIQNLIKCYQICSS